MGASGADRTHPADPIGISLCYSIRGTTNKPPGVRAEKAWVPLIQMSYGNSLACSASSSFRSKLPRVLLASLLAVCSSAAQSSSGSDQAVLIQKLMDRIDELEKRVSELEGEKRANTGAPASPAASAQAQPAPTTSAQPATPAVATAAPAEAPAPTESSMGGMQHPDHAIAAQSGDVTYPSLHVAGFSDIDFSGTTLKGSHSGFNEGQFILHFSSALSPRVSFFGELSFTARADAGLGSPPATGFNVEVERSIIRFEKNDHLKVSFGRYHTPINYWNTAFHHGAWLQTTISRPEMIQFGGSFLPVHFVGALAEGSFPMRGLNLHYSSGIGNGRASVINRDGDFGDVNNNRAWLVNLFAIPDHPYGLEVGGSVYRDKVDPAVGEPNREWIESAHVVWLKESPEFIAEFSNVSHTVIGTGRQFNSQAWYMQGAYRLPGNARAWKPYYRFEYIHIPRGDRLFSAIPDLAGSTAGVRYDLSNFAAFKLEYRNVRRPNIPRVNGIFSQLSFTF